MAHERCYQSCLDTRQNHTHELLASLCRIFFFCVFLDFRNFFFDFIDRKAHFFFRLVFVVVHVYTSLFQGCYGSSTSSKYFLFFSFLFFSFLFREFWLSFVADQAGSASGGGGGGAINSSGHLSEAGFIGHRRMVEPEHPLELDLLSLGLDLLPECLQRWLAAKVRSGRGANRI